MKDIDEIKDIENIENPKDILMKKENLRNIALGDSVQFVNYFTPNHILKGVYDTDSNTLTAVDVPQNKGGSFTLGSEMIGRRYKLKARPASVLDNLVIVPIFLSCDSGTLEDGCIIRTAAVEGNPADLRVTASYVPPSASTMSTLTLINNDGSVNSTYSDLIVTVLYEQLTEDQKTAFSECWEEV